MADQALGLEVDQDRSFSERALIASALPGLSIRLGEIA
jgi:hypothetical protein